MGTYEVKIHGVQVNAIVIDNKAVVHIEITELRSSMKVPIVGLDVMFRNNLNNNFDSGCVVLCVDNCCLIILAPQMSSLPASLRDFLADETISLVCKESTVPSYIRELYGIDLDSKYTLLKSFIRRITEVGYMATRVLKNPRLRSYHLPELAVHVGLSISSTDILCDKKEGSMFTDEQIKCAINQPFTCFIIADKFLSVLDS